MANTWRVNAEGVTLANGKDLLDVFNNSAARVYRVYRMFAINSIVTAGIGVVGYVNVYRIITSVSDGTDLTTSIITHDTANSALSANFSAGTNRTVTLSSLFRRVPVSPDEAVLLTVDWDSISTVIAWCEIWMAGYGSAGIIEPLTCRASTAEGYCIYSTISTNLGLDCEIEFTDSAS